MSDEFMTYVETRLLQWADWCGSGNWYGLGYPSTSIVYRIMTEGVIINSTAPKHIPDNKEAEEIEALIVELGKHSEQLAIALRINYITGGSMRYKAKKFAIHREKLTHQVNMARQWMAGRLSACQCSGINFKYHQSF